MTIHDLELWTHIGVPEEERKKEQRLLVTLEMQLDTDAAAKSDDIEKSIDYEKVVAEIRVLAKAERKTLERFAEDIAESVLKKFHPEQVTVTVKKFALPGTASVSLTIVRP